MTGRPEEQLHAIVKCKRRWERVKDSRMMVKLEAIWYTGAGDSVIRPLSAEKKRSLRRDTRDSGKGNLFQKNQHC
jgi:hypothetical protein